jgi:hypothetical protein
LKKFATLLANNQLAKKMLTACFDIIEFVYSLMEPSCCRQKKFHLNVKTKLIGAEGTRLLREKRMRPRRRWHRGRTARGKRVPGVEINLLTFPQKNCRQLIIVYIL